MAGERSPYDFDDEHDDDQVGALDFLIPEQDSHGDEFGDPADFPSVPSHDDSAADEPGTTVPPERPDDEPQVPQFTVTNPPGTVTVGTFMDGRVQHIELSPKVATMTERDLAEEILVVARLATQDARSAQYAYMLDGMTKQGHDVVATRDFLSRDLDLPSPEAADADRARVFATRYDADHE